MPFIDRTDAGRQLAKALARYKAQRPVVLALPRGGVPVAAEVATVLDAPLDLILVRKIGVPFQPELAMGAVVDGGKPVIVRNEEVISLTGVSEQEFNATSRPAARRDRTATQTLPRRSPASANCGSDSDRCRRWHCDRRNNPSGLAGDPHAQAEQACAGCSGCSD